MRLTMMFVAETNFRTILSFRTPLSNSWVNVYCSSGLKRPGLAWNLFLIHHCLNCFWTTEWQIRPNPHRSIRARTSSSSVGSPIKLLQICRVLCLHVRLFSKVYEGSLCYLPTFVVFDFHVWFSKRLHRSTISSVGLICCDTVTHFSTTINRDIGIIS